MRISPLIAVLLACAPACAQIRIEPVSAGHIDVPTPHLTILSAPAAPGLLPPTILPVSISPTPAAPAPATTRPTATRLAALETGVSAVLTELSQKKSPSPADASSAGRAIEDLMTGGRSAAVDADLPGPSAPTPEAPDATAEARLFASQVEESIAPARPRPEDPENYAALDVPGSVFGWQPIETSPGHGLPPLDALIRFALSDKRRPPDENGFVLPGAARREDAQVYFYGERHTDGALITENMRRLAADIRPGRAAIVLVEGYTGPALRGYEAVRYLSDRGLDADAIPAGSALEVRGWDTIDGYAASKHPLLQHHMDLLELNRLAHGPQRGLSYYADFARTARAALRGERELWALAIVARNADLDRAVSRAAAEADKTGATVHVIAGADHLLQNPRLRRLPLLGRPAFRQGLIAALGGRSYWASKPPDGAR